MHALKSIRALSIGLLMVGSSIAGGIGIAVAQDTATTATDTHPAFIHKGTCGALDPASQQSLTDVAPRVDNDDKDKTPEPQGVLTSPTVIYSFTEVDMKLDDLLSEAHAIAVHLSTDQTGVVIACGDLGGAVLNDDLLIGLAPADNSGFYGVAKLHKDGDKTDVEIFLVLPTGDSTDATPAA